MKGLKRRLSIVLTAVLLICSVAGITKEASATPKLNAATQTLQVGDSTKVKITGTKKTVKWSVSNSCIKITKKAKKYAKIKAVKAGNSFLKAKIGNKTYKCKITVESLSVEATEAPASTQKPENTVKPTQIPKETVAPIVKPTPEVTETPVPTVEPTKVPADTPVPTDTSMPVITPNPTSTVKPVETLIPSQLEPTYIPNSVYVWIPKTGSKYHSSSTCSGMKNPQYVTISVAISSGYTPCSKCY